MYQENRSLVVRFKTKDMNNLLNNNKKNKCFIILKNEKKLDTKTFEKEVENILQPVYNNIKLKSQKD